MSSPPSGETARKVGGEVGHEDGGEAETDNDVMREATGMEAMSEESLAGGMPAVAVEEVEVEEEEEEGEEAEKYMEVNEDDKKGGIGEDGGGADGGGAQGPLQSTSGGLDAKVGAVNNGEHAAAAGHDAHGRIYVGLGMGLAGACEMSDDDEQGGGDREVAAGDVREGGGEAMRDAGGECRRGTEGLGEGKTPNDREEVVTEDGGEGLGDGAGKVSVEEESATLKRLETGCMVSTESREEETDAGETGDVDTVQQDADEGRGGAGGGKVQGNGRGEGDDCEGGGGGLDSEFELQTEEEDDDDHNYEITDFSLATPWERFVRDCEGVLLRWGLGGGGLGNGWDTPEGKASREHTILNSSETKGVKHRSAEVSLQGRRFVLRHVVWLPEGSKEWGERNGGGGIGGVYAGVCGIEALLNKRSSAATSTNYVHELGCCLGVSNYVILAPHESAGRVSMQEATMMRSSLALAMNEVGCAVCGLTPSGPRATPGTWADFPYTFHGYATTPSKGEGGLAGRGTNVRAWCYLDAQASRETADSLSSAKGAISYMRARHCHPKDRVTVSVRETYVVISDGVPVGGGGGLRENWKGSVANAPVGCSDFAWGGSDEPIMRLTLEVTWRMRTEGQVWKGLGLGQASDMHIACQFGDDLACPLAESLERLCKVYQRARKISSFGDVWEQGEDSLRFFLQRGLKMGKGVSGSVPPKAEVLQSALEDMLPSDPDGYTISGQCVAVHRISSSEERVMRSMNIKASPPGGLVALLAKHVADERLGSSMRCVSLLWSEFVSEVRWFWEQGIRIPRMPQDSDEIDRGACLLHQKLQLLNICIRKKAMASSDPCIDRACEEYDLAVIRESEVSALLMVGIPSASPPPSEAGKTAGQCVEGESAKNGEEGEVEEEFHDAADAVAVDCAADSGEDNSFGSPGGDDGGEDDAVAAPGVGPDESKVERGESGANVERGESTSREGCTSMGIITSASSSPAQPDAKTSLSSASSLAGGAQEPPGGSEGAQAGAAGRDEGVQEVTTPAAKVSVSSSVSSSSGPPQSDSTPQSPASAPRGRDHGGISSPSYASPAKDAATSVSRSPEGVKYLNSSPLSTPGSRLSAHASSSISGSPRPKQSEPYDMPDTSISADHAPEGVLKTIKGMMLLGTGEPVCEPITQEHPVLTEDRVEEQELMMLNVGTGSRATLLRARLSGGIQTLKSDMAAFQAANPGCMLEDFVRWYSPRDWREGGDDEKASGGGKASRGRLSARFSHPGNTWLECWRSVIPMPAHKQRPMFDYNKEAERTLHDLERMQPSDLCLQILNCGFMAAAHSLCAHQWASDVESVSNTLARVRHLIWCSDDTSLGVARSDPCHDDGIIEHLEDICTAFGLAEQQTAKAVSLTTKLGFGVPGLINQLCTSGRARVETDEQRQAVLDVAARSRNDDVEGKRSEKERQKKEDKDKDDEDEDEDDEEEDEDEEDDEDDEDAPRGVRLGAPTVREYVCTASGGKEGCKQQLFVRMEPSLFRIATATSSPSL